MQTNPLESADMCLGDTLLFAILVVVGTKIRVKCAGCKNPSNGPHYAVSNSHNSFLRSNTSNKAEVSSSKKRIFGVRC